MKRQQTTRPLRNVTILFVTLLIAAGSVDCGDGGPTGPSVATRIVFAIQPSNGSVGKPLPRDVLVELRAENGDLATGYRGTITLAIGLNPNDGTLDGTLTRNVVSGVASFSDLLIDRAGHSYTLLASSGTLMVESDPFYITRPSIYIAGGQDDTVRVIDPEDYTLIAIVPVGSAPQDMEITPDGALVFVANCGDNTLSAIETDNNTVVATIPVGDSGCELEITPDGAQVWVANYNGISVIETATLAVVDEITGVGSPRDITFTPDLSTAYVVDGASLAEIPISYGSVWATIFLPSSGYSAACTPVGDRVYVTLSNNTVAVVETATRELVTTVPVDRARWPVVVTPDGAFAYVATGNPTVSVISIATNQVVATMDVGGSAGGLAFSADGTTAYATVPSRNFVKTISTATRSVTGLFLVAGSPHGIAVMPAPLP
ncbi:MAG: hypothetical protein V3T74_09695 [Gemmatimonadales bacterium]